MAAHRPPQLIDDPSDLLMKTAQPHRAEVHVPEPVVDRFKADLELGEQVARVDPAMLPAHAAIAADEAPLIVAGIDQRRERRPVGSRRRGVAARRRGVAEGLMWALVVVALPETIKAALLGREVRLRINLAKSEE